MESLEGGLLVPGYVDLQVNGGGGILFNNKPTLDGVRQICAAHNSCGTTSLLVTLITASAETTALAVQAGIDAACAKVPGFLGLHLEGPHLSVAKKGAHDARYIRPMTDADLNALVSARQHLPYLMITVAPESVSRNQISRLHEAGVIVSLGHSDASFGQSEAAFSAGASCATHLYNAMSGNSHRNPGLTAAAILGENNHCGLIADGFHVHPAAIRVALQAKRGAGRVFLVSDAMSTVATDADHFYLDGRKVLRSGGRLMLEDGTLAGADLLMHDAVRYINKTVGIDHAEAVRMATMYPAMCIGADTAIGSIETGKKANFVHISTHGEIIKVWLSGIPHSTHND